MDRVEKLAALLGIADDAQDAILAHCLNAAEGLILDYCALEEIPPRLEPVLLAAHAVRHEHRPKQSHLVLVQQRLRRAPERRKVNHALATSASGRR